MDNTSNTLNKPVDLLEHFQGTGVLLDIPCSISLFWWQCLKITFYILRTRWVFVDPFDNENTENIKFKTLGSGLSTGCTAYYEHFI